MTSKQRVLDAVRHKTPDRVPRNLMVVPELEARLCTALGVSDYEEVRAYFGVDLRRVCGKFEGPLQLAPRKRVLPDGTWEDVWGIRYRCVSTESGGTHHDVISHPLAGATSASDIDRYPWPTADCYTYDHIDAFCTAHDGDALTAGFAHFFCPGADLRGYDTWLMDLADGSEVAQAILERLEAFWQTYTHRVYEATAGRMDVFCIADDYGMQDRMFLSPSCWRKVFKPILKRFVDLAHSRGLLTQIHSCGSIRPIIPDLIDIGFDILDPIQPLARDMNPYELKREFGRDLCFQGGVDIQRLLPRGTVQEVRDEVRRLVDVMGKDGGYILAPAHIVQADVPVENIIALFS